MNEMVVQISALLGGVWQIISTSGFVCCVLPTIGVQQSSSKIGRKLWVLPFGSE